MTFLFLDYFVSVLLSASVKRFSVSCKQEFVKVANRIYTLDIQIFLLPALLFIVIKKVFDECLLKGSAVDFCGIICTKIVDSFLESLCKFPKTLSGS